jgi:hypothetical protein
MTTPIANSHPPAEHRPAELPTFWWLGFPPLLLVVQTAFFLLAPRAYAAFIDGERGLVELGTAVIVLPGFVLGLLIFLHHRRSLPTRWLAVWMLLNALACLYIAGEELSWGQHLMGWETPEGWQAVNDQQETNLHNLDRIGPWLDQKPRTLLELWVLVGGLIYPLWRMARGARLNAAGTPDWKAWFWPTRSLLVTALLAIVVRFPERLEDWFGLPRPPPLNMRVSETQEYYFALFLTLYLASVWVRLRAHSRALQAG